MAFKQLLSRRYCSACNLPEISIKAKSPTSTWFAYLQQKDGKRLVVKGAAVTFRSIEVKNYLSVPVSYQSKCVTPIRNDFRKEYVLSCVLDKHNPYFTHKVLVSGFSVFTL